MTDWEVWHPAQQPAENHTLAEDADMLEADGESAAELPVSGENEVPEPDKPKHTTPEATQTDDLRDLNLAIEIYPEAAVNYLLRGELYAKRREWVLAQEDFKMALQLASDQLEQSSWGMTEQMVMDSAQQALEQLKNNW